MEKLPLPLWYALVSLPLVGVIIGACLTPFVSYLYARSAAKLKLRSDLLETVSHYYSVQVAYTQLQQSRECFQAKSKQYNAHHSVEDDEDTRKKFERALDIFKENIHSDTEKSFVLWQRVMEDRAKISRMMSEISKYWNQSKQTQLENYFETSEKRSVKPFSFEWDNLTEGHLEIESKAFYQTFRKFEIASNEERLQVTRKFGSTLS